MLIKHDDVLLVCLLLSDWKLMTWAGWYSILKLDGRRFLWQNIVRCQNRDCQRDSEEEREPQTGRGERQADMKEKWYSSEKGLSAVGRSITASHYADVNLAVRQEPQQRERDAGRESRRERAEVVGEADNMLSLCKTDRKMVMREMESCYRGGGGLCCWADVNVVSGDQNKELIKDTRAAHWERGHSLLQMHYARTSIE